ncbi:hypothetical protein FJZ41_02865 [Candidatus Shapirobacteria bacterium]|nr:hypothetical protein [Candidatus Shapirobacteria bacterium]
MKLPKKILTLTALFFFLALSLFFLSHYQPAEAQTNIPITVAPARQELLVDPGEQTAVLVKFINQSDEPVSGILRAVDFIVEDKEGSPVFLEQPAQISPRFAGSSWVQLPFDRMTIPPKDKIIVQAKINTPQDASPGGRYFAVYFEHAGTTGTGIGLEKEAETPVAIRLAGLVYLRVSGPIEENAYVTQLTAPRFLEHGPIPVLTEITNRGNYHIRPQGTIKLVSLFGKTIDEEKLGEQNIFPDTSRFFQAELGPKWLLGKYKIELQAAYGETGKILTATVFTWVVPWKAIAVILVTILVIILIVYLTYYRFRKKEFELEEKIEDLEEELEEEKEEK